MSSGKNTTTLSLCITLGCSSLAYAEGEAAGALDSGIEHITVLGKQSTEGAELGGIDLKTLAINTHVVHRLELERLRFVDPDEFLDRIPGETQVRNLRIPDGGKGYTIPMLDGIPMENPYEGATQRLDRTNTFDIERVEVIKGPASALYPNNAFGGVVNVVSRDAPEEAETRVLIEGGDFDRLRTGISSGGSVENIGYFFDLNYRNLNGLREESVNDRGQASGKLIFEPGDETKLTARFEYLDEEVVARGDLTATQLAEDRRQAGGLSSSENLTQNTIAFTAEQLFASGKLDVSLVRREKETVGASRFRGPQDENDLGYSMKLMYRHDFEAASWHFGYDGYDGEQDIRQYARNDLALAGEFNTFVNDLRIDAWFTQYQRELSDDITLTAGLRYEDVSVSSNAFRDIKLEKSFRELAPKFGVTYQLNDDNMIWLGLSRGYYAPDAGDLFETDGELAELLQYSPELIPQIPVSTDLVNQGFVGPGNPDLEQEEATNVEFGIRGSWGNWHYDTSYYHSEIENYMVTEEFTVTRDVVTPEGEATTEDLDFEFTTNAGQVSIEGIETVLEFAPHGASWRVGLTHTYTRNVYDRFVQSVPGAADDLSGKELRRSPDHHLNARIAWEPIEDLTLELEGDFYDSYFADNANSPQSKFKRDERINLRVSYQTANWRFWGHALNLTDTLEDRATFSRGRMRFRTIDGRTLYAGATYSF